LNTGDCRHITAAVAAAAAATAAAGAANIAYAEADCVDALIRHRQCVYFRLGQQTIAF